jgi:2-dehydro-3-deoxygalactonokinase
MDTTHEPIALAAADWGTSSLRIWALSRSGRVLAERRSDEGMSRLQPTDFEPVLRRHLEALGATALNLPVIICGMAGARQGWCEAAYVDIPVGLGAICGQALAVPAAGLDVRILPGLCDRRPGLEDVMRGEETQLLGLFLENPFHTGLVCLPGTHSKWVKLEAGQIIGFHTCMTGELFALLSQHSILRHSLAGATPSGDPQSPGFQRGLRSGLDLMSALFSIRAAGLLRDMPPAEAADTLSGMLIGAEIKGFNDVPVTLIAGDSLATLYEAALTMRNHYVTVIDATTAVQDGLLFAARRLWPGVLA